MAESARIARGNVKPLTELKASDFDVLFMPGGFGAAKNWSDFGVKGAEMVVQDDVSAVMKDFHAAQKYIGMCCISPVVAAKVFGTNSGGPGLKMTLGCRGDDWPYNGSIDAATSFGNELVEAGIDQVVHDETNRIVTSPAYMKGNASPSQVFNSVKKMVDSVAHNMKKASSADPVTLLVSVEINPDRLSEFKKVIAIDAEGSRLEDGCFRFDVLQDPEDSHKFTFYEAYVNSEAVDFHRNTPHFKQWAAFKENGGVKSVAVKQLSGMNFTF